MKSDKGKCDRTHGFSRSRSQELSDLHHNYRIRILIYLERERKKCWVLQ
ncbi:MAG: hypothetical protein SVX43_01255 [Cyanobacteriota bacterium]|nr:hypothetical protein [Cyanobacteriota bacterium]